METSSLRTLKIMLETSTKLYVHEFGFWVVLWFFKLLRQSQTWGACTIQPSFPMNCLRGNKEEWRGEGVQPRFLSQVYKLHGSSGSILCAICNPSLFACYTALFPFCVYLPRYVHDAVNVHIVPCTVYLCFHDMCTARTPSIQLTAQFAMCIAFAFNMLSTCNTLALFCIVWIR